MPNSHRQLHPMRPDRLVASRPWYLLNSRRLKTAVDRNLEKWLSLFATVPSVLWRCWLGGRKGIRPVKNWLVMCWRGYLSRERCWFAYMAQLMPLPLAVSCFSKIQIGFTFLVPADPGSTGQRAVERVCVCVCGCLFATKALQVQYKA